MADERAAWPTASLPLRVDPRGPRHNEVLHGFHLFLPGRRAGPIDDAIVAVRQHRAHRPFGVVTADRFAVELRFERADALLYRRLRKQPTAQRFPAEFDLRDEGGITHQLGKPAVHVALR